MTENAWNGLKGVLVGWAVILVIALYTIAIVKWTAVLFISCIAIMSWVFFKAGVDLGKP